MRWLDMGAGMRPVPLVPRRIRRVAPRSASTDITDHTFAAPVRRQLSPAQLAGVIASVPLAQQTQEMLRAIAFRQAEQRLLEHFALQADDRYGGN